MQSPCSRNKKSPVVINKPSTKASKIEDPGIGYGKFTTTTTTN
jgi:hypothetical protein